MSNVTPKCFNRVNKSDRYTNGAWRAWQATSTWCSPDNAKSLPPKTVAQFVIFINKKVKVVLQSNVVLTFECISILTGLNDG